jgi:hypothetical protein
VLIVARLRLSDITTPPRGGGLSVSRGGTDGRLRAPMEGQ